MTILTMENWRRVPGAGAGLYRLEDDTSAAINHNFSSDQSKWFHLVSCYGFPRFSPRDPLSIASRLEKRCIEGG